MNNKDLVKALQSDSIARLQLKNALRMVIGGHILDGGDVSLMPSVLEEMAQEYTEEIKKFVD